ncbi:ABC-2 transporter permease [Actinomyces slackii]|nr:ABC-2 transporter permease [Actinomyces slackii]
MMDEAQEGSVMEPAEPMDRLTGLRAVWEVIRLDLLLAQRPPRIAAMAALYGVTIFHAVGYPLMEIGRVAVFVIPVAILVVNELMWASPSRAGASFLYAALPIERGHVVGARLLITGAHVLMISAMVLATLAITERDAEAWRSNILYFLVALMLVAISLPIALIRSQAVRLSMIALLYFLAPAVVGFVEGFTQGIKGGEYAPGASALTVSAPGLWLCAASCAAVVVASGLLTAWMYKRQDL